MLSTLKMTFYSTSFLYHYHTLSSSLSLFLQILGLHTSLPIKENFDRTLEVQTVLKSDFKTLSKCYLTIGSSSHHIPIKCTSQCASHLDHASIDLETPHSHRIQPRNMLDHRIVHNASPFPMNHKKCLRGLHEMQSMGLSACTVRPPGPRTHLGHGPRPGPDLGLMRAQSRSGQMDFFRAESRCQTMHLLSILSLRFIQGNTIPKS